MSKLSTRKPLHLPPLSISAANDAVAPSPLSVSPATRYIAKIAPHVYISDLHTATCANQLRRKNIRAVINLVAHKAKYAPAKNTQMIEFALRDNASADITQELHELCELIEQFARRKVKVLVHCNKGRSRAPTVAIAYLMKVVGMRFEDAFDAVRRKVPKADPNFGYLLQLRQL